MDDKNLFVERHLESTNHGKGMNMKALFDLYCQLFGSEKPFECFCSELSPLLQTKFEFRKVRKSKKIYLVRRKENFENQTEKQPKKKRKLEVLEQTDYEKENLKTNLLFMDEFINKYNCNNIKANSTFMESVTLFQIQHQDFGNDEKELAFQWFEEWGWCLIRDILEESDCNEMVNISLKSIAYATDGKWNPNDTSTWTKENYPLDNTWNYVFHLTHSAIVTKIRMSKKIYEWYRFFYQKIFCEEEEKELLVSFGKVGLMIPGIPTGPLMLHQDFTLPKFEYLPNETDFNAWNSILLKIKRVQGVFFCTENKIGEGNFTCVPKSHKEIINCLTYFLKEAPSNPKHIQYSPRDPEGKYWIAIANKKRSGLFFNSLLFHANIDPIIINTQRIRNCVYVKYILFPCNYDKEFVKEIRMDYFLSGKNPDPRPYCIDIFGDNYSGPYYPNKDPLKKPLLIPPYKPPINVLKENKFLGYGFDETDLATKLGKIQNYAY